MRAQPKLNFKPENTDSHSNIILNFEHLHDGSTNLNFGDDVYLP